MVFLRFESSDNGKLDSNAMSWTRRIFLRETLKGWLGLVIAPTVYATARTFLGMHDSGEPAFQDIGRAEALRPGMSKTVTLGRSKVLVARDGDSNLHAVSAVCTHMNCLIRFERGEQAGEFACNCHSSRFTLHGENITGPATGPLAEYRIEAVRGRLMLSGAENAPKVR
jgi:Rieske Fe-S protein